MRCRIQDNKRLCNEIRRSYRLRQFLSSKDRDYAAALGIYRDSIAAGSRTNTNEITYWLDEYPTQFQDEFCICGLYSNAQLIGFVQLVYFKKHRLIFVDYLVLHEAHRSHGEFFQFATMVRDWIHERGFEYDYIAAEVAFDTGTAAPSKKSRSLATVFQQIGFSIAHCEYFQPPLGMDNPQSDMRAFLLIWGHDHPETVKRDTLLKIAGVVFFEHYERWYTPFLPNMPEYHRMLKKRLEILERSIPANSDVVLNGLPKAEEPPLPRAQAPTEAQPAVLPRVCAALAVIWCLFLGLASVNKWFNLSNRSIAELAFVSLLIFVTAFALFNPQGERVLKMLLQQFKSVFRKGK